MGWEAVAEPPAGEQALEQLDAFRLLGKMFECHAIFGMV